MTLTQYCYTLQTCPLFTSVFAEVLLRFASKTVLTCTGDIIICRNVPHCAISLPHRDKDQNIATSVKPCVSIAKQPSRSRDYNLLQRYTEENRSLLLINNLTNAFAKHNGNFRCNKKFAPNTDTL